MEKWIKENDSQLSTSVWLKFNMADREHVALLKCCICSQFSTKLEAMKNFKPAFINGSFNILIPAVKDHAATDMHAYAMHMLKKQQSSSVVDYAIIAECFSEASMDLSTLAMTKKKFDISYVIAEEKLAFAKMKLICELQEEHGVDLGVGYKNNHMCHLC